MIHSAVTYSYIGSWYYNEPMPLGELEKLFFFLFQSHAHAFSMSLFFFVSGYFIPASLERKGTNTFILDRLKRLGIPVLIYIYSCGFIARVVADSANSRGWKDIQLIIIQNEYISQYSKQDFL